MISFFRKMAPPMQKSSSIKEAEKALQTVQQLWQKGKLHEALQQIDLIEQKFPSCSKAAKYYRGEIGMQLLASSEELPEKPSSSKK